MSSETEICREVYKEIKRSNGIHGEQLDRPLGCNVQFAAAADYAKDMTDRHAKSGELTWVDIALEEVYECFAEEDLEKIRTEAIQAAAMFAKMALACDYQAEKIMTAQVLADPDI